MRKRFVLIFIIPGKILGIKTLDFYIIIKKPDKRLKSEILIIRRSEVFRLLFMNIRKRSEKMISKYFYMILTVMLVISIFSCSTVPVCITSSTTPLNNKIIKENLGKSEGSDNTLSLLGLWMIGRPDIDLAIEKAILKKNGDALINVRCYETSKWYFFYSVNIVTVVGDVVKFEAYEMEKDIEK